jgi:MinD-like ATPase involved in chromosome partitioning or flagellar assembly
MTRIIHIAGNSGSGKTALAVNLALSLAKRGRETILVDANLYSPDILHYLDISPEFFLNEFLEGERGIDEVITQHHSGVKVIASMMEDEHDKAKHLMINNALLSLLGKSEIIIVDSFSHNPAMSPIINCTDDTIFMMNDDYPSIAKAKELLRKMESNGIGVIGVVLNRKRKATNAGHIETILGKKVLAEIPHDEKLLDSINLRKPAALHYPESHMAKATAKLAEMIDFWKAK